MRGRRGARVHDTSRNPNPNPTPDTQPLVTPTLSPPLTPTPPPAPTLTPTNLLTRYSAHLVRMPGLDGEPEYANRAHNQLILGAPVDVAERWRATLVRR